MISEIGVHNRLGREHFEGDTSDTELLMSSLTRFRPDEFTVAMLSTIVLASLLPCRGESAALFEALTAVAIGLLFFLQGARLSRAAVIAGALHWRLHLVVFAATFLVFPILGLALRPLSEMC
jgi:sodium/bile acid cotransporter 7